jgi:hypothetical protein
VSLAPLTLAWSRPQPHLGLRWNVAARPMAARDRAATAQLAAFLGAPGRDGVDAQNARVDAVASVSLGAGVPVAINPANGQFRLADASFKPWSFVAGLVDAATPAGFVGHAARSSLFLYDWSASTGATLLVTGSAYFLSVGGGLTVVPPGAPNNLALVGKALNGNTMLLAVQPPVQL